MFVVLADSILGRLGCVLLEVGLWQSLQSFDFDRCFDSLDFRTTPSLKRSVYVKERLIKLTHELVGQVGSVYARAVRQCLSVEMNSPSDEVQDMLCWKVAAALDQCMA